MESLSLKEIEFIIEEFKKKLSSYFVKEYVINKYEKIMVVEDSLVLYIGILKNELYSVGEVRIPKYKLVIEELIHNYLGWKYNHTQFIQNLSLKLNKHYLSLHFQYNKFTGYETNAYWLKEEPTTAARVDKLLPELKLRERYEQWEGILYYFIVLEMKHKLGGKGIAVAYTKQKPQRYVISKGKEVIKRGFLGFGDIRSNKRNNISFGDAFESWKGINRQARLENHLEYFYIQKYIKEPREVWIEADKLLEQAEKGYFVNEERSTYQRPINKWISEELVYRITKKLFSDYKVIYQHRPFFLKSDVGGQMSYDVYISDLKIAIEYQGKQHFEPIEFFGGQDAFKRNKERDRQKKMLSDENGVKLIYINYWEDITQRLIKDKIKPHLNT